MSDRDALLEWLRNVKWENHIDDDDIKEKVVALKEAIEGGSSSDDGEPMNIAGATRIKLVVGMLQNDPRGEIFPHVGSSSPVGDGAVGKTSLLISYATKKFPTDYVPTVFENYTAQMKTDEENILLHLWDTAGQEDYDRLRPLSYPGADVVLLCFSTVNRGSFEQIKEKWYPEVHHYVPSIPHLLVGTKVDLRDSETADPHTTQYEPITTDEGKEMAKSINAASYLEVSAKTRKGLDKVFKVAVDCVLEARGVSSAPKEGGSQPSTEGHPAPSNGGKKRNKGPCVIV
jgi:small GTP-binding protein